MAQIYMCDVCGKEIDRVIAITNKEGGLNISIDGSNITIGIQLTIMSSAEKEDICFSCISKNILMAIQKRGEVVEQLNAVKK